MQQKVTRKYITVNCSGNSQMVPDSFLYRNSPARKLQPTQTTEQIPGTCFYATFPVKFKSKHIRAWQGCRGTLADRRIILVPQVPLASSL